MANAHKGEVEFEAAGKKYLLRLSADAICNLEDAYGKTLTEIGELFIDRSKLRMTDVRTMFVAALRDMHPDIDDAGARNLFKQMLAREALQLVVTTFDRSFDADVKADAEAKEGSANPPQPGSQQDGTGPAS